MQIQPITNQPKFNGKVIFENGTTNQLSNYMVGPLSQKFKEVATLVEKKPYDLFILKNKRNKDFFDVAANESLEKAKKVKEYTVSIQSSIMLASIVDAAKDAMNMYEKYISKSVKG